MSYFKLSNALLDAELTSPELLVFAYLCSIKSEKTKDGERIRVKQATIARKCGYKSVGTINGIIASLSEKGLISERRRTLRADKTNGNRQPVMPRDFHSNYNRLGCSP